MNFGQGQTASAQLIAPDRLLHYVAKVDKRWSIATGIEVPALCGFWLPCCEPGKYTEQSAQAICVECRDSSTHLLH